ncbi:hypothetical protein LS68_007905 [Helicobacter sp. MIT 05-5293]|uniref:hypothetical protein n=1 Tax=Helicobacter sp. MIT 05-5293 TaxID=1548149 RepID=UPI00051CD0C6|nr:hypothetical protein [Helicobacter sp. MIT 05-5293]TLD80133.1 hypothetical protein LS68_007905 [Helicobacter sp. MIT 05-5293]
MSKNKIVLTAQDRKELTPLLHLTKAERKLMPQEVLQKLEVLAREQDGTSEFQQLEEIIEESLNIVQTLELNEDLEYLRQTNQREKIKDFVWWSINYKIFLAHRRVQRARRRAKQLKQKN